MSRPCHLYRSAVFMRLRCSRESQILLASQPAALSGSVFYIIDCLVGGARLWCGKPRNTSPRRLSANRRHKPQVTYYLALAEQWRTLATINKIKQVTLTEPACGGDTSMAF